MNYLIMSPFIEGFGTSAALIIAIGAQNAFVLKQGILKNHVFATALTCALIDALLIALGIGGFGAILASSALLLNCARWGGAIFLFFYGLRSFRSVLNSETLDAGFNQVRPDLQTSLRTVLALSFLNPHVYLDTVVLLGSIGAQFPVSERPIFAIGSITASFFWFFSLGYGARFLAPLFKKPLAWKILDFIVGIIMWSIAYSLVIAGSF